MGSRDEWRREKKQRDRSAITLALLISLLAHLAVVPPLLYFYGQRLQQQQRRDAVRLVSMSPSAWKANRRLQTTPPPRREADEENDRERDDRDSPEPPGQVVALPPPEKSQRPEQADYAAEHDATVERETRSRYQTADALNPAHRPQTGDLHKRDRPSASKPSVALVIREGRPGGPKGKGQSPRGQGPELKGDGGGPAAAQLQIPKLAGRDALKLRTDPSEGSLRNREHSDALNGQGYKLAMRFGPYLKQQHDSERPGTAGQQGGAGNSLPGFAALMPDLRDLERLSGAPLNDYLPDVEQDEGTFLNTWRWKHAPFFNRIADSIRRQWRPGAEIARRDPTGNVYGFQDRYTLLRVTIDHEGGIDEVVVAESCGVDFLDQEALQAFNRAQPFSNPPHQLFAGNDTYTFMFGFNVDFQTSPLVRFNWRAAP